MMRPPMRGTEMIFLFTLAIIFSALAAPRVAKRIKEANRY